MRFFEDMHQWLLLLLIVALLVGVGLLLATPGSDECGPDDQCGAAGPATVRP